MKSYSDQVIPRLLPGLQKVTEAIAASVAANVVEVMRSSSPSGHTDEQGYQSSAPGQAPAYGRGVYAGSWGASAARLEGKQVIAEAYSSMRDPRTGRLVGDALEHGDEDAAPRPHIRPGLHNAVPDARAIVNRANR